MNKPSSSPRRRRNHFPELSFVTDLIGDARRLRLSLVALSNYPQLAEPAKEAVTELQNVSAKLERLAELVAGAKTRSRKRRTKEPETSPPEPSLGLEDTAGDQL
jgi:hypothetical protein